MCADEGEGFLPVLDLLTGLIEQSLVIAEETKAGVRYRMLETIRQYALDELADSGELVLMRRRRLDLCASLTWWWMGGRYAAGENACAAALAVAGDEPTARRAAVVWARALLARHRSDYVGSFVFAQEALEMAEAMGDPVTTARALWSQSALQLYPDPVGCRPNLHRALDIANEMGDDWLVAHATSTLGYSHLFTDEFAEAERLFLEGMPLSERIGAESTACYWLGLTWGPGARVEPERCFACGERAVAASREIGDPVPEAFAHNFMGALEADLGRPEAALARLTAIEERVMARRRSLRKAFEQLPVLLVILALTGLDWLALSTAGSQLS